MLLVVIVLHHSTTYLSAEDNVQPSKSIERVKASQSVRESRKEKVDTYFICDVTLMDRGERPSAFPFLHCTYMGISNTT